MLIDSTLFKISFFRENYIYSKAILSLEGLTMRQIFTISLLIILFLIIGCSTQQMQPTQPQNENNVVQPPAPPVKQTPVSPTTELGIKRNVEISGFEFNPNTITIPKGANILWTNIDSVPHTIFSDSGDEIHSDSLIKGETYAHTFNAPGTYKYHCGVHPSMKGVVVVE